MRRIGDLAAENAQRLAEIEVRDNGKLLAEMQGQLRYISDYWHYFAGLADKIEGSVVPIEKKGVLRVHAARAGGRRRCPDGMELAPHVLHDQMRPGARRWMHGRAQTLRIRVGQLAGIRRPD